MILPKEMFDRIDYFEHSMESNMGTKIYDVFTIHFKGWWRRKKVIKIRRRVSHYDEENGTMSHHPTESAADLYNQLNNWATATFQEKLTSVKKKYEKHDTEDNVIILKPKPKDIDDE